MNIAVVILSILIILFLIIFIFCSLSVSSKCSRIEEQEDLKERINKLEQEEKNNEDTEVAKLVPNDKSIDKK